MPLKVSIALDVPIRFKRITNGERVIEQTGPDENEIDVREDDTAASPGLRCWSDCSTRPNGAVGGGDGSGIIGRVPIPSCPKTMGAKYHRRFRALFGKQPQASTRNKNRAAPTRSSNPAVQSRRGQNKTGAVPSRKATEFAPGRNFENWRGGRGQNQTTLNLPFVPATSKTQYIPSFEVVWTFHWGRISDGEKVIDEAPVGLGDPTHDIKSTACGSNFKSRRSLNGGRENQTFTAPIGQRLAIYSAYDHP